MNDKNKPKSSMVDNTSNYQVSAKCSSCNKPQTAHIEKGKDPIDENIINNICHNCGNAIRINNS